jgi:hypothetical protein
VGLVAISLSGIIIIVGNYGSGKTEVSVNLAAFAKDGGTRVSIVDLDLVNPYFRAREARQMLEALGIAIILPAEHLLHADLPILVPQAAGRIGLSDGLLVLDVGGDDAGATVLAALADAFKETDSPVKMLQVVNPFRPNTDSVEGCMRIRSAIESTSRLTVNGWIGNANLIEETTVDHITHGVRFVDALSKASGLPVEFITVPQDLLAEVDTMQLPWPVLPIQRQMVPPWTRAADMGSVT